MALPTLNKNGPCLLLVEGPDDQGVAIAMLACERIEHVFVFPQGGCETLRSKLAPLLNVPGRTHLGIIVDADADPAARWQSLCDVLRPMGYDLPDQPDEDGTIREAEYKPRLGIWVMPNNASPGMVEDFVSSLAPTNDPLLERAKAVVADIPADQCKFKPTYRTKAEIHTWLAWQEEPGRPMGQAIAKAFLNADATPAVSFRKWLTNLFG